MKKIKVHNFTYHGTFGTKTFSSVDILIPDHIDLSTIGSERDLDGIDYSISVPEIKGMEISIALDFLSRTYKDVLEGKQTFSIEELRKIREDIKNFLR